MRNLQLQVILDAVDRATGPLKQIAKGSAGAGQAIRQTRDHLKELQDQQKRITAFTDMQAQAKSSKTALSEKSKELKRLNAEIAASDTPGKKLVRQQAAAQKQVEQLTKRYGDQLKKSRALQGELPAKAAGIRNLGHQQSELAKQVDAANKRLALQQDALKRLGEADVAGKFRNMSTEVGRFARQTLVATTAAAGGIFAWAKSTATLGDEIAHAADRIGVSRTALQELRFAGERGGGMDVAAIDASLLTFTRRLGLATRGTGAAVKAYDELGLSAETLSRMQPERALAIVADRLAEIGDHNDQLSYASQIFDTSGGANMLKVLKDGSAGLREYSRQARLTGYILSDQAVLDSEIFNDALDNSLVGLKGMKNIIGAELMPVVTELMQTFSGWMIDNRAQVQAFATAFGQHLKAAVPIIVDLAKGGAQFVSTMAKATQWLARLVGGFDNLAVIVAVLFAGKAILSIFAFGKALMTAGGAVLTFSRTLPIAATAMKILGGGIAVVGTALKAVAAFLIANPIVLLIAAIAGAAYLIYKHWDGLSTWFASMWGRVSETFSGGIGSITKTLLNWSPLGLLWKAVTAGLGAMGVRVPVKFATLGSAIIDGMLAGMSGKLTALRDVLANFGANAVTLISNQWSGLSTWFSSLWASLGAIFNAGIGRITKALLSWSPLGLLWKAVTAGLSLMGVDVPAQFANLGSAIVDGLIGGITRKLGALKDAVTGAGASAVGWFKEKLGISSPSKVFAQFGINTMEGYQQGLQRSESQPLGELTGFIKRLRQAGAGMLMGAASTLATALPASVGLDTAALSSVPIDTRGPLSPTTGSGGLTIEGGIHINVQALPGMDEQALARFVADEVQRALTNASNRAAATRRSAFHDID